MPALSPVPEALQVLLAGACPVTEIEILPLDQALGRVLAETQFSPIAQPPADNSAMDGYALRLDDWQGQAMTVSQRLPAGAVPLALQPGTAARLFTGAEIPPGADAVIMQEETELDEAGRVSFTAPIRPGQNIRPQGGDIAQGAVVVPAGTRLAPAQLGLLASVGIAQVPVFRRLKVALLTTGDELVAPGLPLGPGQIYNSNRTLLTALLTQAGCQVLDCGDVPDTAPATRNALAEAARHADLIISTGGVSVGEEDHVKGAVEALGKLERWAIAIKPGKPFAHGRVGDTPFIGLPGNPISGFVTYAVLVRPYLRARQGMSAALLRPWSLPAGFATKKPGDREEYLRVRLGADGRLEAYPNQGSGVLSSAAWGEGLARVPAGEAVSEGQRLDFFAFADLLN